MSLNLLSLLDDIATTLDDVAIMTKVAAKKTSGIIGDDLAVGAEQISDINKNKEFEIVMKVMKGSFINKLIIVPICLFLNYIAPDILSYLLLCGGLFLCYEGMHKVLEKIQKKKVVNTNKVSEEERIQGAIKTDLILSAEIIVISLNTMVGKSLSMQVISLSIIAIMITFFIYGLVAIIVKIDDLGSFLISKNMNILGLFLLHLAPSVIKILGIVGTIAMFMVGGGIISHKFHVSFFGLSWELDLMIGICAGLFICFGLWTGKSLKNLYKRIYNKKE